MVTLWHIYEHFPEPALELNEFHRILHRDGLIVLSLPNIDGLGFRLGSEHLFQHDTQRHLDHNSVSTLTKLLIALGFIIENVQYLSSEYLSDMFHKLTNSLPHNRWMWIGCALPIIPLCLFLKMIAIPFHKSEPYQIISQKA